MDRINALEFKIGRLTDVNDMLFHGKVRVKLTSKISSFLCELNVARAKRDEV